MSRELEEPSIYSDRAIFVSTRSVKTRPRMHSVLTIIYGSPMRALS